MQYYARARVEGAVRVDPEKKLARVELTVSPGPPCRFGDVIVEGNEGFPATPIRAAADIRGGVPFSLSALRDARRAVSALGPFASVILAGVLAWGTARRIGPSP